MILNCSFVFNFFKLLIRFDKKNNLRSRLRVLKIKHLFNRWWQKLWNLLNWNVKIFQNPQIISTSLFLYLFLYLIMRFYLFIIFIVTSWQQSHHFFSPTHLIRCLQFNHQVKYRLNELKITVHLNTITLIYLFNFFFPPSIHFKNSIDHLITDWESKTYF